MAVEPSIPGRVRCMKCGREFFSPDRLRIRRCLKCKTHEDDRGPRVVRTGDFRGLTQGHPGDHP